LRREPDYEFIGRAGRPNADDDDGVGNENGPAAKCDEAPMGRAQTHDLRAPRVPSKETQGPERRVNAEKKRTVKMTIPGADDFRIALLKKLTQEEQGGKSHCDVKASDLLRAVGEHPDQDRRVRACCEVMRQIMRGRDRILAAPGTGYGANLSIRYTLPRTPPKIPQAEDFRAALRNRFAQAQINRDPYIDVQSADLHREVGHYPSTDHRMPICCEVMRKAMRAADKILQETPSGQGASLLIRYTLPRT
jgi:hypothetical protein